MRDRIFNCCNVKVEVAVCDRILRAYRPQRCVALRKALTGSRTGALPLHERSRGVRGQHLSTFVNMCSQMYLVNFGLYIYVYIVQNSSSGWDSNSGLLYPKSGGLSTVLPSIWFDCIKIRVSVLLSYSLRV